MLDFIKKEKPLSISTAYNYNYQNNHLLLNNQSHFNQYGRYYYPNSNQNQEYYYTNNLHQKEIYNSYNMLPVQYSPMSYLTQDSLYMTPTQTPINEQINQQHLIQNNQENSKTPTNTNTKLNVNNSNIFKFRSKTD